MTLTLLDAVAQSTASAERKVLGDKKLFTLVYVGDSEPRPASDDEAEALGKVLAGELVLPPVRACSKENPAMPAGQSRAEPSVTPHTVRPAGPCMHCGVPESPQWRKGPPAKPVLCNACGTRYRRTSQLGATHRPALCPARSGGGQARKRCADQDAEDRNTQGVKSARQYVM